MKLQDLDLQKEIHTVSIVIVALQHFGNAGRNVSYCLDRHIMKGSESLLDLVITDRTEFVVI